MNDFENAVDDEDIDDLKAYKIMLRLYENSKINLDNIENKLIECKSELLSHQNELEQFNNLFSSDKYVFSPINKETIHEDKSDCILNEINKIKENIDYLNKQLKSTRECLAEYSFVLSTIKNKISQDSNQSNSQNSFINKLSDKIDFILNIMDSDRNRAKEELIALKNIINHTEI